MQWGVRPWGELTRDCRFCLLLPEPSALGLKETHFMYLVPKLGAVFLTAISLPLSGARSVFVVLIPRLRDFNCSGARAAFQASSIFALHVSVFN